MEKLLSNLIEHVKLNKKGLIMLKNTAVRCKQFELASQLRELEVSLFPETEEAKEAMKLAKDINLALRMVELDVSEDVCWLISQTLKIHSEMGGEFSMRDAAKLITKQKELFDEML